jgi:folate-binding protein YgfZ
MDAAFYDRTARGRLIVTGRDRRDLLHRLCTNDVASLTAGTGRSTCFLNRKGQMIDWAVVLDRGDDLLVLTANPQRVSGHIQGYTISEDVTVRNYMALEIVVCGPDAARLLGISLEPWSHANIPLGEVEVLVARIEPLWGDAYAILAPDAVALRRRLSEDARPVEPDEVDFLRIKSGIPAHPNEINEQHNPWEARLDSAISLEKGCYVGQEVVARLHTYDKVQRRLVGLRLDGARETGDTLTQEGNEVGAITTVAGDLALGYVARGSWDAGTVLDGATVVELPMNA